MKVFIFSFICVGAMCLTSCGLLRTATQVPLRALQTVTRTAGFGLESSESEQKGEEVKFEQVQEGFKP